MGLSLVILSLIKGIEVDKANVQIIENLPPPTTAKGVRSFLGHVDFYRRFIKDFSKIAKYLTHLLVKDGPFEFNEECLSAFLKLKEGLSSNIASPGLQATFQGDV